jgi:hypothetical protein
LQRKKYDFTNAIDYLQLTNDINELNADPETASDPEKRNQLNTLLEQRRQLKDSYDAVVQKSNEFDWDRANPFIELPPLLKDLSMLNINDKIERLQKYNDYLDR